MQFPWREYSWCILLICLAIGLAVEQTRVRKFTASRDAATRSEQQARELADQICAATNTELKFKEFSDLRFFNNQRTFTKTVDIDYVPRTDERKYLLATDWLGEFDLMSLPLLVLVPQFLLMAVVPGWSHTPGTRFSQSAFLATGAFHIAVLTAITIMMFSPLQFVRLLGSKPVGGALCLSAAAIMTVRYLYFSGLSRDELENLVLRTTTGRWKFGTIREALRMQLRDFFWLLAVIGLVCAVYLEHRQSRALSEHEGRAEWWKRTDVALQQELKRVSGLR